MNSSDDLGPKLVCVAVACAATRRRGEKLSKMLTPAKIRVILPTNMA